MCLVTCKFARQSESVQLAILKRHNELSLSDLAPLYDVRAFLWGFCRLSLPPSTNDREPPLSKPSVEPRPLTAEERRLFQNPDKLHGNQFVLSASTGDAGMFEVIGYHRKRDKSVQYEVVFGDCDDPILLDEREMMNMLDDSLYLPH
jgi:hypothetical protein